MIWFGPSGNSDKFYAEGYKHTYEAPKWLSELGLNAFEYSFGRGINLGDETAAKINTAAKEYGIRLSVHAPYYINFANPDPEKRAQSRRYILDSVAKLVVLGGSRCVFHPGSSMKNSRTDGMDLTLREVETVLAELEEAGHGDITICPETMGKLNQLGDLTEVLTICNLDKRLIPTIDFGHLHARGRGEIQSIDDYRRIIDAIGNALGEERMRAIHVHFSKIAYTQQGEKMHMTFQDTEYGPDFEPLARILAEYKMSPVIISESKGTMAEDAVSMKALYEEARALYG